MNEQMLEILKAKASAVRGLTNALIQSGVANEEALRFVTTWTEAVESMIPAGAYEAEDR